MDIVHCWIAIFECVLFSQFLTWVITGMAADLGNPVKMASGQVGDRRGCVGGYEGSDGRHGHHSMFTLSFSHCVPD